MFFLVVESKFVSKGVRIKLPTVTYLAATRRWVGVSGFVVLRFADELVIFSKSDVDFFLGTRW